MHIHILTLYCLIIFNQRCFNFTVLIFTVLIVIQVRITSNKVCDCQRATLYYEKK